MFKIEFGFVIYSFCHNGWLDAWIANQKRTPVDLLQMYAIVVDMLRVLQWFVFIPLSSPSYGSDKQQINILDNFLVVIQYKVQLGACQLETV